MTVTTASITAILKETYEPGFNEQMNLETTTLRRIEKTSEGVSKTGGRKAVFAVHVGRNEGIGARNELELLPAPGQQGVNRGEVTLKHQYGAIELSGQSFELANQDFQTFIDAVDLEMNYLPKDLAKDLNRQVYSDGTGKLATVSATASGNTITVSGGTHFLRKGMPIDVYSAAGAVRVSNRIIVSINRTAGTFVVDGAALTTVVATDIVTRFGNINREWEGFGKIISDSGVLHDIDPADEELWKSEVDSTGGVLTELKMLDMAGRIKDNGGSTTVMFTTRKLMQSYWSILQGMRQIVNTQEFTGGFKGLSFIADGVEIPMVTDIDAPIGTIHFVNEKEIRLYRNHDWKFMDRDGNMWVRKPGYDAYNATMYQYSELGTHRRNTHGKMTGLTES